MEQGQLLEHLNRTGPVMVGVDYYKTGKKDYLLILAHRKHILGDNEFIYQFLSEIGTDKKQSIKEKEFFGYVGSTFGWDYRYYWLKDKDSPWAKKWIDLEKVSERIKVVFLGNGIEFPGPYHLEKINFSGKAESFLVVNTDNLSGVNLFQICLPLSKNEKSIITLTSVLSFYFDYKSSHKDFPRIWIEFYDAQNKQMGSKYLRDFSPENKFFKIPFDEIISPPDLNKEAYLAVTVKFTSPGIFYMRSVGIE